MKIAVVGCGWLGSPLALKLIEKGFTVSGTSRDKIKLATLVEKGLDAYQLKFEDFDKNNEWLNEMDVLVLNIPPSNFKFTYAEKMLNLTKSLNSKAKVIFISSTSVYENNDNKVDENTEATGGKRNGKWVLEAENSLKEKWGEQLTIIRMSGLVGGERHPAKFMSGKTYSNGDNPVNLIHLKDCMGIITSVIEQNFWGQIVNGVCAENPSKKEYYTFVATKLGVEPPVFSDGKGDFKEIESVVVGRGLEYELEFKSPFDFPM